jgi:dienelactone hydrolase
MIGKFISLILPLLLFGCSTAKLPEIASGINGTLYLPDEPGPHPAVVVLHGSGGMRDIYQDEAQWLSKQGYVALVLDYYARTGKIAWLYNERVRRWKAWEQLVVQSLDYLAGLPEVDADRLGIWGMSQGGALALSVAHEEPRVKAVVDYFAPDVDGWYITSFMGAEEIDWPEYVAALPPVMIIHGGRDPIVPIRQSEKLHEAMRKQGKVVQMVEYTQSLHALNDPMSDNEQSLRIARDARGRSLEFLEQYLRAVPVGNGD